MEKEQQNIYFRSSFKNQDAIHIWEEYIQQAITRFYIVSLNKLAIKKGFSLSDSIKFSPALKDFFVFGVKF